MCRGVDEGMSGKKLRSSLDNNIMLMLQMGGGRASGLSTLVDEWHLPVVNGLSASNVIFELMLMCLFYVLCNRRETLN